MGEIFKAKWVNYLKQNGEMKVTSEYNRSRPPAVGLEQI